MIKKNKSQFFVKRLTIIVVAFAMLFSLIAMGTGCSYPNHGRIRGVNGGEFAARFYRYHFMDWNDSLNEIYVFSDTQQLLEWTYLMDNIIVIGGSMEEIRLPSEIFKEYTDSFFKEKQLIVFGPLLTNTSGHFETRSVNFVEGVLTIKVRDRYPRRRLLGISNWLGVMEITRIDTDFAVDIIGHGRQS